MKKFVKKIFIALCACIMCVIMLTGCSWLERDNERYYKEVVVTIGDDISFTKKNLVDAFSSYGYQYYQSYGNTLEESINKTIENMIDRKLLLDYIINDAGVTISNDEKLQIKKEAFDYMVDSINTYVDQVRKEWDIEIKTESAEESSPLRTAQEEYTPTTEYTITEVNGVAKYTVVRVEEDEETNYIPSDFPEHFTKSYVTVTEKKVFDEAWTRYIKSLQDLAKAEGKSTKEEDVILGEEERLITLLTNNKYLEKFENNFLNNTPVDVESVLKYYREKYNSQLVMYNANPELYHTAMQSASSDYVYYHLNSGNEYVNVKHILINFTQAQKDEITTLNTRYGITNDNSDEDELRKTNSDYQRQLQEIINRTKSTFELDGETYTWSANQIYSYVRNQVEKETIHKNKSKVFNDLIYVFNDDTGEMNSEFDYVVNLDTDVTDQMVKPFADGVRALDTSNGGAGAGSMDMIVSTYGLHIIFHDGVAENIVDEYNINSISDAQLLAILCSHTTRPDSNKSIFNYIYDTLKLDENLYNNMTSQIVANIRTQLKENNIVITYYKSRYEDLWK